MLELMASIENLKNESNFSTPLPPSTTSSPVWFIALCCLILCICILGNVCVIYLVKTRSSLQEISNTFIVSLAISDLLVGVFVFPSRIVCESVPGLDIQLQRVFSELFLYWSVYNLCGMTIERFVFIVCPMKHHLYMSKQRSTLLIGLCWLIPLVNFSLHFTFLYSKSEETRKFWLKNFTAFETITMVGVPSFVLVILYTKIFTVAQRHRKLTANQISMVSYNKPSSPQQSETLTTDQRNEGSLSSSPNTFGNMLSYNKTSTSDFETTPMDNTNDAVNIVNSMSNSSPIGSMIVMDNECQEGVPGGNGDFMLDLPYRNNINAPEDCNNMDIGDTTPGNSANTGKCLLNEGLSNDGERLAKMSKNTSTDCRVLSDGLHKNRKGQRQNESAMSNGETKCNKYFSEPGSIDNVSQTVDAIKENDTCEHDKTVDGFLNRQTKRIRKLASAFQNSFTVIHTSPNRVGNVQRSCHNVRNDSHGLSDSPADQSTLFQANNSFIENQLDDVDTSNKGVDKIRKQPIIESNSSDEAVRYLAFYSAVQSSPKVNKQSIKRRLGQAIQKRKTTGASVVGSVIATFLICWGVTLYASICFYFEMCSVSDTMTQVQWLLLLFNSAVNPIVYAMLKTDLRKEFANLIRCRRNTGTEDKTLFDNRSSRIV